MKAKLRSDKRKTPTLYTYRFLTQDECRLLPQHLPVYVLDRNSQICQVKVTKVVLWKRRADVEVHWKFGLYEYDITLVNQDRPNTFFIEVQHDHTN